jgi:hypothetical protein
MDKVEVGKANEVGVGGGTVLAGIVHPTSHANPSKSIDRVLVFILVSSFIACLIGDISGRLDLSTLPPAEAGMGAALCGTL